MGVEKSFWFGIEGLGFRVVEAGSFVCVCSSFWSGKLVVLEVVEGVFVFWKLDMIIFFEVG